MECTINDINLSFDKDNRLRSTIGRVSGWSVDKAVMLAAQLQTEEFKNFLKENLLPTDIIKDTEVDINNIKDEDYVNIKQNKFGSLLNAYYLKTYHSVNNSKTNRGAGRLMGFSSSNAKGIAKNYVADLVIDKYQENLNKPRETRKNNTQIIREVIDEIDKVFLKRADEFANNVLNTDKYGSAAKEYARKFLDVTNRMDVTKQEANDLYDDIQSTVAQINEMNKRKLTKSEREAYDTLKQNYDETNTRHKNLTKAFYQLKRDRAIMAMNLINLYSSNIDAALSERNKNFLNLYLQVKGNPNQFFFEVFHTKKMTNLVKEYDKLGDINEYEEADEDNDDIITDKFNDQSTDETSKSWEDNLYKNFNQTISTKMRFILARVPKLAAPFNPTEIESNYDTENELGVRIYYDPSYLTLQIHSFADFSSAEAMVNSLDSKSKEIKSLYGLGELVNQMRQDREFTNYCYANFAKPLVNKVMVTINTINVENGIEFDYSNPNAFNEVKLGFDMLNKLRATYNTNYDINDSKTLIALDKQLRSKGIESVREKFQKILLKYFPNFDSDTINNIFKLNNAADIVTELIRNLNIVVQESGNIKKRINDEYDTINKEYNDAVKEWNNKYAEAAQNPANKDNIPNFPTRKEFNPALRDLTPTINKAVLSFAHIISQYNESHARMNTANAAGNTASDIIKNNFVSRFFDMILAEDDGDSEAGLKAFGQYLMQGCEDGKLNQYSNNPLFFGLKDINGQIVKGYEGMFRREGDSTVPNPNAKQILKYALFDGVRNNNTGVGTVYDKMSKIDFFITQYIAFDNSLAEHTVESGNTKEVNGRPTAVYSMRIGSDAPKIFMIRAPRYSIREANFALYNHFLNELTMFVQGVNNLFEIDEAGNYVTKRNINGLISRAYFDEREADKIKNAEETDFTKAIVKDGKLVGNMFKFLRLFDVVNNSFGANIEQALSLYGPDNEAKPALFVNNGDGRLRINRAYTDRSNSFIKFNTETNRFELSLDDTQRTYFLNEVNKWSNDYLASARNELGDYIEALKEQGIPYTDTSLDEFLLNSIVMNMNYDDMFEGDFKYYNSARDFLKRTKETQAGGDSYNNVSMIDSTNEITESSWNGQPAVINIKQSKNSNAFAYNVPTFDGKTIVNKPMIARNGWRAVTIRNVVRPADEAQLLQDTLEKQFIKEGMDKERAYSRAVKIAAGYWANTKANDAQSYITLEEFIRRKDADGTLNEYQDILAQLLDPNISAADINLDEINARIQVQKNFYYDKVYNSDTKQFIPRQIKNAEFVLIPKLLPEGSELIKVYNWMRANDIGQLNTAETDKAAKKNILDIWIDSKDKEGNSIIKFIDPNTNPNFDNSYIQNYKYKYLYKQQDVPQHMIDEKNKLGAQISKKILDNVSTAPKEVQDWANEYQDAYTENIRQDFMNFITIMGWELDSNGRLVNSEYATTDAEGNPLDTNTIELNRTVLNLDRYYARARQEAIRLGMDSNFMEYLTTDEFGRPLMPNSMNNVQQKLESVGQALFNRAITRQVLPGWHAAQITGVGYSRRLKFNAETGVMEVYLPRWSKLIPKDYDISKLESEGLDIHLGYRIPTEGKQSISVLKVVGFTPDCLGSTIVVPDAWITQTGSDFDVDSIYGICWEMYASHGKDGKPVLHKIPYEEENTDDRMLYIDYVNERLDTKIKRDNLGNEIKDRVKIIKDNIRSLVKDAKQQRKGLSDEYDKQDAIRNEIYNKRLPAWARGIIRDENKIAKTRAKENKVVVDLTDAYPTISEKLSAYLDKHSLPVEEVNAVHDYIDQMTILLDIINAQRGIYTFNKDNYYTEKTEVIQQIIEDNINNWLKRIEDAAKETGIIDFAKFVKLPHVQKLGRRARNNYILDRMIKIMSDSSSREEQYGRSQFEDIAGEDHSANTVIDRISGTTSKLISPYNPLTQLDYFDDAMGGAGLKAISVNWDTFVSKSNRVHGVLSDNDAIEVILNLDGKSAKGSAITYNEKDIIDAFGDAVEKLENNKVKVKLNKFGWSNNNKGITGNYITTSTAETTAHHLDAIKSGSISGVNPYTFGVYKIITCLGLDHEFSVGFIRQPIIQRLVSNYNLTQSIYFGGANDPINMTFADIASDLGLTTVDRRGNTEPISKNTYIGTVLDSLHRDSNFINAFNNIFGVDISNMSNNDILNLKFPLRKDYIFQRIETAGKNGTNKIDKNQATAYNQAVIDFSMLIMFRQMNNTVFRLNNIIQFSSVDKIGAKPSIRETRRIQENIDKYRTDSTITVNGKNWADALFPKDTNGNIDVDASVNKPIAASYAYATLPSIQVGKQVFITENDDYVEAERYTERIIGRRLNEQEYKEWRRYVMLYMYNSIKKLLTPLCVDKQGRVMYFKDETFETSTELKTAELWNPERSRIVGYGIVDESDFSVADINKPTGPELAAYTKLTPAQKVLFVQRNFPDNQGIFNYLKVTMISNANIRRQGISRQYISYDDQVDSIENLFLFFENSFDNKNPLVKLAIVDLIKYAFIAEGFNFRSGYITKIIINSSLYNDFNQGGMDIINSIDVNDHTNDGIFNRLRTLPNELETTEFVELYVRSHPDIIKTSRINSLNSKEGKIFRAGIRADGLIHLDNTVEDATNQSLIKRLKVNKNVDGYVRIDFPTNGTNRVTVLFYVAGANPILDDNGDTVSYADYFLIPLNQLESYECYTNSYNANYNKFNDVEYYNALVEKLEQTTANYRYDPKNYPNPNSKYKPIKAPVGKYVPSTGNLEEAMTNPEALSSMYFSADNFIRGGVRMLVDDIRNNYLTRVAEGNFNAIYILNNNSIIGRYIPVGKYATQTITDNNGQPYSVIIAHVPIKAGIRQTLKQYVDNETNPTGKDADEMQFILNRLRETNTSPIAANIYRVTIAKQPKEIIDNNIRKAATIEIDDVEADTVDRAGVDAGLARRGIEIDSTSSAIIRQITYDAHKNNSAIANEFVRNIERRGVNKNYRSSLREHRFNIYTAAARYYQSAANAILNNIDRYKIGDDYYDLSTPEAYEALAEFTEEFGNVARILLDALTFGNRIDTIFNLDIATEDKEIKDAIENIRRTINKVRTNTKIQRALSNIINVYFKKYSTNPLIVDGIMQLRDTFGDTDTMIKYIFDAAESHSPEVQVILKQVYTSFSKAEMFETQHNLKEWRDDIAKIDAMTESLDMSKVIDFNSWRLKQDYNEDYLKERDRILNEYNEAKRNRFDSVEAYGNYLRKQLARDKFNYEHKEQPIVAEYYKEDIENRERALERGGESYIKYRMLSAQLYELKRTIDENNEEEMNQITNIKIQMNALKSITDGVGSEKAPHLKQAAEAINDYIAKRREILEKYFDSKEYDGFQETYSRYNSFIKSYDNKHSEESLADKLENPEYSEAYNWIKTNGYIGYTKEAADKIAEEFKKIVNRTTSMSARTRMRLKNINGAIDDAGIINPIVLTDEQIDLLRQEEESELASKYANGEGEIILIKEVPRDTPITIINKEAVNYKTNPEKMRVIGRINEILSKAVNHDNGHIDIATLFNNDYVTDAEREELGRLYNQLYNFNNAEDKEVGKVFTWEINENAYNNAMTYYHTHLERTKQGKQFLNIFTHLNGAGQLKPNRFIYGFKTYKDDYIDSDKTAAVKFIRDNIEYVPSEYYYQAMKEASVNGTYEQWFNRNHIYNPFSHRYEPLKIWTIMKAKPDSELAKQVEYIPSFDNMERSVKKEYINDKYKEFGTNYKRGDNRFDSNVNRNAKEQAMYDLIQRTLTKYASTYQSKRFIGQGYLPRERETQVNGKWMATQLAALFGMSWHSSAESDSFSETVDYTHDRDADMDMLNFLKGKGSKQYKHIPIRADYKTDKEYEADVTKVREENRKIAEENRKIDAGIVSKNFRKVMEDFVYNATIFNSRQAAKPYLYLLLEDLQRNDAYKLKTGLNRHLIRDYDRSTSDDPQYRMTRQRNTYDLIHNLARRLLFNQYHEKSTMRNIANFLQNLTSAKFMVFNLYGGIANITTGSMNIAMEQFANDYFGVNDFRKAQGKYLSNSAAILASAFTDKAPNLEAALCKQFKVVDFDQVLQFGATSDNLDAKMRKVRDFLYSFQSMGEHYMQNSVMFAMLKSNRIYTDTQGNVRIGDFKDFTTGIEVAALRDVLASRPDLLMNFQMYIDSIRNYDVEKRLELSMGRTSIVRSFLYTLRDNIDPAINSSYEKIATEFNARRKEMMKEARTQFNENPTVESIYEYKDGQAVVKKEIIEKLKPQLGEDTEEKLETMLAGLREKVKVVNKKIHGVYDKNGAALLENKWWGSIFMQYHKHLPMGILKRYRRRGYYSEFRGSMERGTYQSIIDFLGTEFTNFKNRRNRRVNDGTNIVLASLQTVFESALNTIHHFKLNWGNLDNWEQANIRRNLAEVGGVLAACLLVIALYGLSDDDDINDDRFKASCLYLADRLYSETTMYGPQGLISEYNTAKSNPFASMSIVNDLAKAMTLTSQYLLDPNYNPEYQTGRYAGENKLEVLIKRNISGYRSYDRILTIDKNNNYYKVGESQIGINVAKNFGELLNE